MASTWYAVYDSVGNLISIGTVLADKKILKKKGLIVKKVSEADITDPLRVWDANTKSFVDAKPVEDDLLKAEAKKLVAKAKQTLGDKAASEDDRQKAAAFLRSMNEV